jgi:hypothetical protein
MKSSLFLAVSLLFITPLFSQTKLTNSVDSVTASTTAYATSDKQPNLFDVITIQADFLKTAGAPSFYAIPQGSLTGVGYKDISTDTAKGTNVSTLQSFLWTFDKRKYLYYRVMIVSNGTAQGFKPTVRLLGTPPPGR